MDISKFENARFIPLFEYRRASGPLEMGKFYAVANHVYGCSFTLTDADGVTRYIEPGTNSPDLKDELEMEVMWEANISQKLADYLQSMGPDNSEMFFTCIHPSYENPVHKCADDVLTKPYVELEEWRAMQIAASLADGNTVACFQIHDPNDGITDPLGFAVSNVAQVIRIITPEEIHDDDFYDKMEKLNIVSVGHAPVKRPSDKDILRKVYQTMQDDLDPGDMKTLSKYADEARNLFDNLSAWECADMLASTLKIDGNPYKSLFASASMLRYLDQA